MVTTRRRLLLLLRKHPGATVTELASDLGLTGMAVRRHIDALASDGLIVASPPAPRTVGRPPTGWRLSAAGLELFPRRYDSLALDVLEDLAEQDGPQAVDELLRRRNQKLAREYEAEVGDNDVLELKVAGVARLRDQAGYLAEWERDGDGFILTENNCAVHRVAERHPSVCALELELLKQVFGPDVDVSRQSHTMAGDAVCSYRIAPRPVDPRPPG